MLETFTPATIASPGALVLELTQVRATGYATNRQERYTGVTGIAAPIIDRGGKARYALGLQGPSIRLTEDRLGQLARQLLDAAAQLQGSGLT